MSDLSKRFDDELHSIVLSEDGSYTAYSKEYDEHYHSTRDGALRESLTKHIIPAFKIKQNEEELNILDICFGLGFNTLATIYYHKKNSLASKLNIYSPELDESLVKSLKEFTYPKEFDEFKNIILSLSENGYYDDGTLHVEIFFGDAREYVRRFKDKFHVVYQDAFSPAANPSLWTEEYFSEVKESMREDALLTTYSISLKTRLALYNNGFNIYINSGEDFRDATVASCGELSEFKSVDMKHKIFCNPHVEPLKD